MSALRVGISLMFAVLFVAASSVRADFVNGGFESPATPPGSFLNYNTGADIGGWTVVGPQASTTSDTFIQNGFAFHSHSGDAWLDLTGFNANSAEGVEQSVATTIGSTYTVTFFVGNVIDPSGVFGSSSTVDLYIDGVKKTSAQNTDGTTQQIWKEFNFDFVAANASTTVKFINADPSSDNANGLDDVSIALKDGPPPSVPLPAAANVGFVALALLVGAKALHRIRFGRTSAS